MDVIVVSICWFILCVLVNYSWDKAYKDSVDEWGAMMMEFYKRLTALEDKLDDDGR